MIATRVSQIVNSTKFELHLYDLRSALTIASVNRQPDFETTLLVDEVARLSPIGSSCLYLTKLHKKVSCSSNNVQAG